EIERKEIASVARMTSHGIPLVFDPPRQQDPFDDVQPPELPRTAVSRQVVLDEVPVHEGLVLLVPEVRLDHLSEKVGILARQEKVELVAGELAVLRPLLVV